MPKSQSPKSGLVDSVRSQLTTSCHGFRPWHERLPPEHAAEVNELARAWKAGELGSQMRPVAVLVSRWLNENKICTVGIQGVTAWLKDLKRS